MRIRKLLVVVVPIVTAAVVAAQSGRTPAMVLAERRGAELRAELAKSAYEAKRSLPASEDIFVENGQVIEALFVLTVREKPLAIPAGSTTFVSKVVLLDRGLHIYFADNRCAVIVLTKEDKLIKDMSARQLLDLAKEGIGVLFTAKERMPVT
jgi:hypothetical protein